MRRATPGIRPALRFLLAATAAMPPLFVLAGGCGDDTQVEARVVCRTTPGLPQACTCDLRDDNQDSLAACKPGIHPNAFCCADNDIESASPGDTDICGCGFAECYYGQAGCYCQRFEYGADSTSDTVMDTPCTAITPDTKCCASASRCSCEVRSACPDGETETTTCDVPSLSACGADRHPVAKCDDFGSSSATGGPTVTSWAVGNWLAPPYDDDSTSKHIPVKGLGIRADGTYEHNTGGIVDDTGTWSDAGGVVTVGSHGNLDRARNCGFMNYNDGDRVDTYYRDDAAVGCPETIAALTPVERCLLGTFEQTIEYDVSIEHFTWTRTDFRNQIFDQVYTGNGDAAFTAISFWEVKDGQLCSEGVDRVSSCVDIDWAQIDSQRTSLLDPGCVLP